MHCLPGELSTERHQHKLTDQHQELETLRTGMKQSPQGSYSS